MSDPQSNYSLVTNRGLTKHAAAIASGASLVFTHIAFGDADRVPNGSEAALGNEVARYPITAHGVVPGTPNEMFFDAFVPDADGPFVIRETGLFDADGELGAIAREGVPINKVTPASGRNHSFTYRIQVAFSRLDAITVQVAPGALAYVPYERRIDTGFGLLGGGSLAIDRVFQLDPEALSAQGSGLVIVTDEEDNGTLNVNFASPAETLAGSIDNKAAHPAGVKAAIAGAIQPHPLFFYS